MNSLPDIFFVGVVVFLLGFLYRCLKRSVTNYTVIMGGIIGWLILVGHMFVKPELCCIDGTRKLHERDVLGILGHW